MMSDHGLHMGLCFLFTEQGFVEHKLPFLATLIPERFLKDYPELRQNLDDNEQKLISAYDIYATFKDLLNVDAKLETKEKNNYGIKGMDISEVKFTKISKRNTESIKKLEENIEEKKRFKNYKKGLRVKDTQDNNFLSKNNKKQNKNNTIIIDTKDINGVTVWGKSLLRKIENRKCEDILIKKNYCVCN